MRLPCTIEFMPTVTRRHITRYLLYTFIFLPFFARLLSHLSRWAPVDDRRGKQVSRPSSEVAFGGHSLGFFWSFLFKHSGKTRVRTVLTARSKWVKFCGV